MPGKSRYLLVPMALIYGGITRIRNLMYDKKVFRSATFDLPLICVGNLAVGGTGKTPMVEYLVRLLHSRYQTATLSRGYRRKSRGFLMATGESSASDIGDEPMQIHQKFPDIGVAVAEERVIGIPQLLFARPQTQVIILDDAFQHREVAAGLNILLTAFQNPYTADMPLPAGHLRDNKKSSERADIIIVTKCKSTLSSDEKQQLLAEIKPLANQSVFFTSIHYETPYHLFKRTKLPTGEVAGVLLVCGIADPKPVQKQLEQQGRPLRILRFRDHHQFDAADIRKIQSEFEMLPGNSVIVTTEKDAARLSAFAGDLDGLPLYVLPMAHQFLFDGEKEFDKRITGFVESYLTHAADPV